MYEKKLRNLLESAKTNAEAALDAGDDTTAAQYYEQCGDILQEMAKNRHGTAKERKEELAEKYYNISDNLRGADGSVKTTADGGTKQDPDDQDFSEYVERFIQDSTVTWGDVAGLTETKKNIKQSFALAAIQDKPDAVEGLHSLLLYGPPGTGKSLLASAIAGSHDYTFFNVKLSQALSKYYGESGKIISDIFDAAREKAPSIVFFDEIDALAMSRGDDMDEASRRVLSTLLTELSGFDAENEEIMFLAATNTPWDVDDAILSRMERNIYVPLPDEDTAEKIIRLNTVDDGVELTVDMEQVAERCVEEQYSGREIKNLCQEAIRHMVAAENPELEELSERPIDEIQGYDLQTRPITEDDIDYAFDRIDPQTDLHLLDRYRDWAEQQ